jgi:hypothetical protein
MQEVFQYSPFPPERQKRYFRPNERHILQGWQFVDHVIQNITRLRMVVAFKRFQPARIIVRMRYNNYLQIKYERIR